MMLTLYAFVNYFYFPYFLSQLKLQISSTKLQTNLKLQISITKTINFIEALLFSNTAKGAVMLLSQIEE